MEVNAKDKNMNKVEAKRKLNIWIKKNLDTIQDEAKVISLI